ncbi:MAG: Omp28-related outer membrane protein [Bacteroidota bacterium]
MKSFFFKIGCLVILFYGLTACNENKPIIPCLSCDSSSNPIGPDPNTVVKKVLLEEFTGVRCVNCPLAKLEIDNLQSEALFGEDFIAVAYHAGFFARPYAESQIDFRTEQGDAIIEFLDQPIGFPSGVVNRKRFSGEDDLQIEAFATWGGFVAQELNIPATISLDIETTYNEASRDLNASVMLTPLENISEAISLSVLITEDDISDVQLTPDGRVDDFKQTHVFRTMLSNTFGNSINETLIVNQSVSRIFSFNLPEEWVAEKCKVVAFVHQSENGKEVLQAEEVPLVE